MIKIKFPDNKTREYKKGITGLEIANSISSSFAKKVIFCYVNSEIFDLLTPIYKDSTINFETDIENKNSIDILNHSSAHIFAKALVKLYPDAKIAIGPAIDRGFHYDFSLPGVDFSVKDFSKIEKEMRKIILNGERFEREVITYKEALDLFSDNEYKIKILKFIKKENPKISEVTIYKLGDFYDLCKGPHLTKTSLVKSYKLLNLGGAYFQSNKKNTMINRVFGISRFNELQLKIEIEAIEERKKNDHRLIGKELNLFTFNETIGKGFPIWLPKGNFIKKQISNFILEKESEYGYEHIQTPILGSKELYKISGHLSHYKDSMFPIMKRDGEEFVLRPMSCPHHCLVFSSEKRSYRNLPIRLAEEVIQHRYESSGSLLGLERVRSMELTDSHIFTDFSGIKNEIKDAYKLITEILNRFKISIHYVELALHDSKDRKKYYQDAKMWNMSEELLENICDDLKIKYIKKKGEAAFYGPKIDIQVKTSLGHIITMSTIQLDFLLPKKFNLKYTDKDGNDSIPILIHRGLIGTYERFISILLEQTKGILPLWLSYEQVRIIPVNMDAHSKYAEKIKNKLSSKGIRSTIDNSNSTLPYKIRDAQTSKVPYQIVIGDNESKSNTISFRKYGGSVNSKDTVNLDVKITDFIKIINKNLYNLSNGK